MLGLRNWQAQLLCFAIGGFIVLQVSLYRDVQGLRTTINDQSEQIQNIRQQYEIVSEFVQARENVVAELQRQATAAAEREANLAREKAAAGDNAGTGYFEPLALPVGSPTTPPLLGPSE